MALMAGNGVVLKPASLTLPDRAAHPARVRARRAARGPAAGRSTAAARWARRWSSRAWPRSSSPARSRWGAAWARRARGGSRARCSSSAARTRCSCSPTRTSPNAVSGALWGGFANAGQTCSGIERVYVAARGGRPLHRRRRRGRQRLRVGDPLDWATEIGPMVSQEQFEIVRELVDDAVAAGATLHCGGPVEGARVRRPPFYAPAVLTGVTHDMRIMREEIFGPVLPIVDGGQRGGGRSRWPTTREFGLGASVWTRDRARGRAHRARARRRGWCGSTTTCTPTAPASARGAA